MTAAPQGAKWIDPIGGAISDGANTSDVTIKWDAGPNVGSAVYQANANYVWGLQVNVVQIKVETPDNAFTTNNAVDGVIIQNNDPRVDALGPVKTIFSGPANGHALEWDAKITLTGPGDGTRGVAQLKVGFAQEAEIVKLNATYDGIPQQRVHDAQGKTYTDGDAVNSTKPWYLTTDAATFFNPTPGAAGWNVKTITAFDTPGMYFPVLHDKRLPNQNRLDKIELDYRFHLSVIAQTVDTRNDADELFAKRAKAEWSWNASQDLGAAPNYAWNPVNVTPPTGWAETATGEQALITAQWGNEVIQEPAKWGVN